MEWNAGNVTIETEPVETLPLVLLHLNLIVIFRWLNRITAAFWHDRRTVVSIVHWFNENAAWARLTPYKRNLSKRLVIEILDNDTATSSRIESDNGVAGRISDPSCEQPLFPVHALPQAQKDVSDLNVRQLK